MLRINHVLEKKIFREPLSTGKISFMLPLLRIINIATFEILCVKHDPQVESLLLNNPSSFRRDYGYNPVVY